MAQVADGARPARRRRWWPAATVAALALTAGACGSEAAQEAAERSPDPVVAAAGKAGDEDTARITFDVSFSGAPVAMHAEGTFAMVGDDAQMTMTMEATDGSRPPESLELLVVDGTSYVQNPQAAAGGPQWFRVPVDGQAVEGMGGAFTDPVEAVGMLDSVVDAQEAGTVDIDGEQATLYRGTVDLTEAAQDPQEAGQLAQLGLDQLPVEVVVDGEGRLRRITITADLAAAGASMGAPAGQNPGVMTITVDLVEFGVPLEVTAPPADQVADLPAGGRPAGGMVPPTTAAA